eukprot:TRINITY_DN45583_c0_g1_i1.p1 TRINITY_DN45583_c0_g1~~TRINITY_DN45583_c0_g1_i1.p1  ORF type:complete len:257 (+),score=37.46 TRINITY_DN45583_c0_g1_i1:110-772(+)
MAHVGEEDDAVPSFGGGEDASPPGMEAPYVAGVLLNAGAFPFAGGARGSSSLNGGGPSCPGGALNSAASASTGVEEDELTFCASADKVQEVTEQIAEFLVTFSPAEQRAILAPFLRGDNFLFDDGVEPHIDEARRFTWNYLAIYSQCERDLILEKWRPAIDTASLSSRTESLTPTRSMTPSVTPPGSTTPTAATPRGFLSARREVNETYHSHSPSTDFLP